VILLDTNVLSALMNNTPDPAVVRWLDGQTPGEIWTSAISVFEVRFGLSRIKLGRKRQLLEIAFDQLLVEDLAGRIASVDRAATDSAGLLAASREAKGRPVDVRDTLIAAIAVSRRSGIATRNVRHFLDLDVPVVDPWQQAGEPQ
jgi:predicted nucleic acid-binding protein